MTKKKETKTEVETTPPVVEQQKVEKRIVENLKTKKNTWEIKDRTYFLKGGKKPLSYIIK